MKKKRQFGTARWILLIICAIVFFGCAGYIGYYFKDKMDAQNNFTQLGEIRDSGDPGLAELYEKNNDFVGWLKINGTRVDYPVMQTPDNPEYYLHRDFDKKDSVSGTPFLDAGSVVSGPGKTWNWFIYGHNMKFGTMFHDLMKYENKAFWKKHSTFTFDTYSPGQAGNHSQGTANAGTTEVEYEIVAAAYSKIRSKDSTKFKYYQYYSYTDEQTFNEFVAGIKDESLYDTGITPEYGDQLVTLSTCAYQTTNGRFYIVGRRIK